MNRLNSDIFRPHDGQIGRKDDEINLGELFAMFRRNWWILALCVLTGLLLAIAHVATTTPRYTSQIDLNVTSAGVDADTVQDFSGVSGAQIREGAVQTEIEILRSERITERVVRMMDLHQDPDFLASRQHGLGEITRAVRRLIGTALATVESLLQDETTDLSASALSQPDAADLEAQAIEAAARRLRADMQIATIPDTRVLQIRYTSTSPDLSARVANAIARAFIDDQIESTEEASQRAIDWLRERRDQLRDQSERATQLAQQFRADNNLQGADVSRPTDAEFDRLTADLVAARAELVELESRSRRLTEIVENQDTSAVARETAAQGITSGLRSNYLETLRNYNNLVATLGPDHAQTQRRARELQDLEGLMFEEIRRNAQLVRDDIRATRERVASLEEAQMEAGGRLSGDQVLLAELRELETNATTLNNLYTNFQQRYQEAVQRREVPTSSARVLNRAQPGTQTEPNGPRIQAFGGLLGFMIASGIIMFREWRDDRVRTEEQIREDLGLEYLGGLNVLKGRKDAVSGRLGDALAQGKRVVLLPELMTYAADKPLTGFAEALRTGKMSLSLRHGKKPRAPRVGIVSCFPSEGKTTVAANFANLLAQQGARVMLIDGDMRNPGLSRATGKEFDAGLIDVLMGEKDWRDIYYSVQGTGLHILPNSKMRVAHTSELMGSDAMTGLLDELDQDYDYVIVDLPPLGPVIDTRVLLDRLDGLFFVFKWGETHRKMARRVMRYDPRLYDKCYGAFLNMIDPKKQRSYEGADGYNNYRSYYNNYYRDN